MLKLLVDCGPIRTRLEQYGVDWERQVAAFLDAFLGEGMHGIWGEQTRLERTVQSEDRARPLLQAGWRDA